MMYVVLFFGVCFLIVLALMAFAPEGFEDDLGWHRGKKDE